jgi:predicted ribonuclease toxin of YeeF-YezG toxin-antitoxin module
MKDITENPPEEVESTSDQPSQGLSTAGMSAMQGIKGNEGIESNYARPSGYRDGVKDEVFEHAKASDGLVRDPLTKEIINPNEPWDMGHKPGYEFRKHQESAEKRGISRNEFLDEYNNPEHYRPELPSSNRSHKGELLNDSYFGP